MSDAQVAQWFVMMIATRPEREKVRRILGDDSAHLAAALGALRG